MINCQINLIDKSLAKFIFSIYSKIKSIYKSTNISSYKNMFMWFFLS